MQQACVALLLSLIIISAELWKETSGEHTCSGEECTRHWIRIIREANGFCAGSLAEHCKQLRSQNFPERLVPMSDRISESIPCYRRGLRWCNWCHQTTDNQFKNEPDYSPPKKVFFKYLV